MGQTLETWRAKVRSLVRDPTLAGVVDADLDAVGILPAVAKFSVDRPRMVTVEQSGAGSPYLAVPAGWEEGVSIIDTIEYPARRNPPIILDSQSWRLTWDPVTVGTRVVLLDRQAATGQYVRVTFSARWPVPAVGNAAVDLIDDVAYEAVAALAASLCLTTLATQVGTMRERMGEYEYQNSAQSRVTELLDTAKSLRALYDDMLGLNTAADTGPVSVPFDFDPQFSSLYHGGRR